MQGEIGKSALGLCLGVYYLSRGDNVCRVTINVLNLRSDCKISISGYKPWFDIIIYWPNLLVITN